MSESLQPKPNLWYLRHGTRAVGPFCDEELRDSLRSGRLAATDLVWNDGVGEWRQARDWAPFREGPWPDQQLFGLHSDAAVIWVILADPNGERRMTGPWSFRQIRDDVKAGRWRGDELIWSQGMTGWARLADRPELRDLPSFRADLDRV